MRTDIKTYLLKVMTEKRRIHTAKCKETPSGCAICKGNTAFFASIPLPILSTILAETQRPPLRTRMVDMAVDGVIRDVAGRNVSTIKRRSLIDRMRGLGILNKRLSR